MEEENLESLTTQCPHCKIRFRVTEHQLALAGGRVRCGACLVVFQGVEYLAVDGTAKFQSWEGDQLAMGALLHGLGASGEQGGEDVGSDAKPGGTQVVPDSGTQGRAPRQGVAGDHPLYGSHEEHGGYLGPNRIGLDEDHWPGSPLFQDLGLSEPSFADEVSDAATVAGIDRVSESVAEVGVGNPGSADFEVADAETATQRTADRVSVPDSLAGDALALGLSAFAGEVDRAGDPTIAGDPKRWSWVRAAMVMAASTLALQVLWFQFDRWSVDPEIRPAYAFICAVLGCQLPDMRDLDGMVARNLVVRSHPEVAGALVVKALIVNEADFAQPFPNLELRVTALHGVLVAGREFTPDEYLGGELRGVQKVASNVPVYVELAIEDPGEAAVNYFLSFH